MTFTTTPPTTPGTFLWRPEGSRWVEYANLIWAETNTPGKYLYCDTHDETPSEMHGEWCRLVPAQPILEAIDFALPFHEQCYRDKQPAGKPPQPRCRLQGLDTTDYCPHCKIFVVLENAKQVAEGKI